MDAALLSFLISGVLIVLLLIQKSSEIKRESRPLDTPRRKLDKVMRTLHLIFFRALPEKALALVAHFGASVAHFFTMTLLRAVRFLERKLVAVIRAVRGRREFHRKKASPFLSDVADHKQTANGDRRNGYYGE